MSTTERATYWSLTINNPTPSDEEAINIARQKGWKVEGQLEKGKEGTPHYQLMVKTPQIRFSTIKKVFPRGHLEIARNAAALEQYVHKEESREAELPTASAMYPSLSKLWDLLYTTIPPAERMGCWQWTQDEWLIRFDKSISILIRQGYHVETMAVNPQIRTAWKKFALDIIHRHENSTDRQTDRHEETFTEVENITIPHADHHDDEEVTDEESIPQTPSVSSQSRDV